MAYQYNTLFKWINVTVDYLLLNLSLLIGHVLGAGDAELLRMLELYAPNFLLLNLLWFYCSTIMKLYDNVLQRKAVHYLKDTAAALVVYLLTYGMLVILLPQVRLNDACALISFCTLVFLLLFWKSLVFIMRNNRQDIWMKYKKVVIVGTGLNGQNLSAYISDNPQLGYTLAGVYDEQLRQNTPTPQNRACTTEAFFKRLLAQGVSELYCALPNHCVEQIKELMQEADKHLIRFRLVPDINGYLDRNVLLELYGNMPVLTNRAEPLENKANEVLKRVFDICFSVLVIVLVLSWVVPLVGLLIKLESRGPVFFRQLRSGKGNKPFYCLKFRSMAVNADADARQASRHDCRITKVGAFIRKTSIDELPQFINVLLGEMSVVGPRPHMLKHTEDYSLLINNFMVRHFLTPGITGWAQVKGLRGETRETQAMCKRVEADLWYLENWSILLDMKIVLLTIWQVIRGNENAY